MIDALMLYMALTLCVAGYFLFRDHVRFLRSTYTVISKVASIQPVFISRLSSEDLTTSNTEQKRQDDILVRNGFYPVIEYPSKGGAIQFTAIDPEAEGRFHVGDKVKLRVSKTRRKENRACKTAKALGLMLFALCGALITDMVFNNLAFTMENIFLASGVIAICFAALVSYVRDCDETCSHGFSRSTGGHAQLCLFEPTAFKNWRLNAKDPVQVNKIRSKQFFGATCFCSAMLMVAMTV